MKKINMKSNEINLSEITVSYQPNIARSKRPSINTADDAYKNILGLYSQDTIHLQEQFIILYLNYVPLLFLSWRLILLLFLQVFYEL
jgi:hypothetical protein